MFPGGQDSLVWYQCQNVHETLWYWCQTVGTLWHQSDGAAAVMFLGPKCLDTISVIHLADQPCTSTSSEIARDTVSAFLDRPFAEGKCNFMFYWHLWNVNTPVGLQSLINTCHVNSMSHVTEYLDLHADVYHHVHQSCRLKNAYKAKKAKQANAASTVSTCGDSQCNGHVLFQWHVSTVLSLS